MRHAIILASTCVMTCSQVASAATPSPEALAVAGRLIHTSGFERRLFGPVQLPDDATIEVECVAAAAENPEKDLNCERAVEEAHRVFKQAAALRESRKADIIGAAETAFATHLSLEDMQAASAFFESPAGQRFIAAGPDISKDFEAANRSIITSAVLGHGAGK